MSEPNPISAADVRRVATLSRLALDESEVASAERDLAAILGYVDRLSVLDLDGVEPLTSTPVFANRLAPDEPGSTLPTETLMRLAPATHPPFVAVPKVIGGGESA